MASIASTYHVNEWLKSEHGPTVISGPCSAETEEQVLSTAKLLAEIPQVKIFRAGVWKPRTRPGMFEGVGEVGLKWLNRVQNETGLKVAVEVAYPAHIDLALKYNIDILWIGARTVVNPFSLQELANQMNGSVVNSGPDRLENAGKAGIP